jgi:hypothetical protein
LLTVGAKGTFPRAEELVDVASLALVERHLSEDPPRLGGVVVLDCRLEMLADRRRLSQLAAEPAE